MKRNGGGWAKTKRRKERSWRRHLTSENIGGVLLIVGVIVVIASIWLIVSNLYFAAGEKNEQLWKGDVNELVRDARYADATWIMIPHLELANQILIDHGYEPTLDEFIERAEEIENSWNSITYRKGLYLLKRDLSEWPVPDISHNHLRKVVSWLGALLGGLIIGWIGWKGMEADC